MNRLCPNGHEVNDNLRFCPKCGAELKKSETRFCKKCGTKRIGAAKFCSKCGTPFEGVPTLPSQDTNHMGQASNISSNSAMDGVIIIPIAIVIVVLVLLFGQSWLF